MPEAAFLLQHSIAPSTQQNCDRIRKKYESFCRKYHYTPYPSSFETLPNWLGEILPFIKPATAKSYLSTLKFFHVQTRKSTEGLNDERLDLVIRGGRQLYGDGTKAIRCPITSNILIRMVNEIATDEKGFNVKAAFCMSFAAFLRSGEFT